MNTEASNALYEKMFEGERIVAKRQLESELRYGGKAANRGKG